MQPFFSHRLPCPLKARLLLESTEVGSLAPQPLTAGHDHELRGVLTTVPLASGLLDLMTTEEAQHQLGPPLTGPVVLDTAPDFRLKSG